MSDRDSRSLRILKPSEYDVRKIRRAKLCTRKKGKQRGKRYKDIVAAFDIETTNVDEIERSFMYIWQMQIEDDTIVGRTWEEFLDLLERIASVLHKDQYLCVYIFNASFEFQFLRGVYRFEDREVFAGDRRDVIKFEMFDHIEFRCAYHLTNMSLRRFLKQMNVADQKTELDYSVYRYPWTKLTDEEMLYCINDVRGLVEALRKKMEKEGTNVQTIPLTSTGYVRKAVKRSMDNYNREQLHDLLPSYDVYLLLREAFRGGNVHGNRWYSGEILHDVKSYDRVSSYPDVMINGEYPMGPWTEEPQKTLKRLVELIKRHRPFLLRIALTGVRMKDKYEGCPYLSRDKCRMIKGGRFDNGRILEAEYFETTLTDIDWKIILDQYVFDEAVIFDLVSSKYGKLPEQIRDVVKDYYRRKTVLKGAETEEEAYQYARSKELLNSCYGMMVQDPVKESILFNDEEGFHPSGEDPRKLYEKQMKKTVLSYAWGVYVAAAARAELWTMIKEVEKQGGEFLYCDTDSVKFFGDVDFFDYDLEHQAASIANGGTAFDRHGVEHPIGVLDLDGTYKEFKFLGSKKYAYVDMDDKLHITIAGVDKKIGAEELAEAGGLEAMKDGFTFRKAGGTESLYFDEPFGIWHSPEGDVEILTGIYIRPSTYTLGSTAEYIRLLEYVRELKYSDRLMPGLYERNL